MEISPVELKQKLERKDSLLLIDIRETKEYAICHLEGSVLIPIKELPFRLKEIDPDRDAVLYCHHGVRSAQAAGWLRKNGFTRVYSLKGGIDRWAETVDPTIARY